MGQRTSRGHLEGSLDLVITNAVIIDWTGIYKVINTHHQILPAARLCRQISE
jgi:urease alpha subunit